MPYLRINRDKRGYEYYSLVQPSSARRGKVRQRLLYWFRTPPNLKLGRSPFDEDVMRALEAQYPDVEFDWEALRNTPMPPPSSEPWRERRRAEKAARLFREADDDEAAPAADEGAAAASPMPETPPAENGPVIPPGAPETVSLAIETASLEIETRVVEVEVVAVAASVEIPDELTVAPGEGPAMGPGPGAGRGRRRRRGRRGRAERPQGAPGGQTEAAGPPSTTGEDAPEPTDDEDD